MIKELSGKEWFQTNKQKFIDRVSDLKKRGINPGLGTILVGDDSNSQAYVSKKINACKELGINSFHTHLDKSISEIELLDLIKSYNDNKEIHAYIVQLPLPKHIDEKKILMAIDYNKDADGLHPYNFGALLEGTPNIVPATPLGILRLLIDNDYDLADKNVVIVGRGVTIGRPLAALLSTKLNGCNAAVTVVHSGISDISKYTKEADVVIAAAGVPSIITKEIIKDGVVLVSAGMTYGSNRVILPDVDENCREKASAITKRVGGVGPMTIAMLISNALDIAEKS